MSNHNTSLVEYLSKIASTLLTLYCLSGGPLYLWLKATNERQDDGAGILHQAAQFPIDKYTLYTRRPCPPHPRKTQRDKVLAAKQVGLYVPLNPPPLAQRGS